VHAQVLSLAGHSSLSPSLEGALPLFPLRFDSLSPSQTEALAGGNAVWKTLRRGAGRSLGHSCQRVPDLMPWFGVMPAGWRGGGSPRLDPLPSRASSSAPAVGAK
jgi:hypothetical protein